MTKVDFYILNDPNADARARTACKITEKAYQQQLKVYIHTTSASEAKAMDDLLWTYRAGSFLPHCLKQSQTPEILRSVPILIGHADDPLDQRQVLLNLTNDVPLFFSQFDRVAEVVGMGENDRDEGRKRYRFYKDRGYELATHELSS